MRILCFKGKFGYLKDQIHEGIILFCHFEPRDNERKLTSASKKVCSYGSKLILVPFVHLYENAAPKELSDKLFKLFCEKCKNSAKEVVVIPFGIEKEFHLYAPADDSAIKFVNFK